AAPWLLGFSDGRVRESAGATVHPGDQALVTDSGQGSDAQSVAYYCFNMYSSCREGGERPRSSQSEGAAHAARPGRGTPLGGRGREARTDFPPWSGPRPLHRPQGDDVTIGTDTDAALNSASGYRLRLVFDAGPTMPMWRPLLRKLRQSLAQSGHFQSVTVSVLMADGTVRGREGAGDRLVTLVLSDCSG